MTDTTVDVVIPAHGRPALLGEAIESVLLQTYPHFRLVVVDDASAEPLQPQLSFRDERLAFVRTARQVGPGAARNLGVRQGRADLIAFLDSDDLWHPEKLARQVAMMHAQPGSLWSHTDELWLRHGKPARQTAANRKQGGEFLVRAFERCLISPSAVMFRRQFFEQSGGFHHAFRLCEDFELWLRLLSVAPVLYLSEKLVTKRSGDWPQLSAAAQIDRYRVLALHRYYRLNKHAPQFAAHRDFLFAAAIDKCKILLAGAKRHDNRRGVARYQAWLILFSTLRTRDMR